MNDTNRRVIAYTLGSLALSGLLYGGFFHQTDADAMTLLGSAEVHLQLAASMPEQDGKGAPSPERARLLEQAAGFLARARQQDPELFIGFQFAGWMSALQGDFRAAAGFYKQAQSGRMATAETKESDLLNEVRMWRAANEYGRALAALDRRTTPFSPENASASQIQRMLVLDADGRSDEALKIATGLIESTDAPLPLLDAGHLLERRGRVASAEKAFAKAAYKDPIANYFLARLKIRAREFDTGLNLLKRAVAAQGSRVRTMLKRDRESWAAVKSDERFKGFLPPGNKAATPGR